MKTRYRSSAFSSRMPIDIHTPNVVPIARGTTFGISLRRKGDELPRVRKTLVQRNIVVSPKI